jgi:hypothetical protein
MKATTIRFGQDVWDAIAAEAERAGVSTAQYIRDAALARAAAAAGARGEELFNPLAADMHDAVHFESLPPLRQQQLRNAASALIRAVAADTRNGSLALRAESQQARRVARSLQSDNKRLKRST